MTERFNPTRISKGEIGYGKKEFQVYVQSDDGRLKRILYGKPEVEMTKKEKDKWEHIAKILNDRNESIKKMNKRR